MHTLQYLIDVFIEIDLRLRLTFQAVMHVIKAFGLFFSHSQQTCSQVDRKH